VNPGHQCILRIPFDLFDHEDIHGLASKMPAYTIARKEKALSEQEWKRLAFDKAVAGLEPGIGTEESIAKRREALRQAIAQQFAQRMKKSPRQSAEGCRGLGCNGCLRFWHDPECQHTHKMLAARKQGQRLATDMREAERVAAV
jgi:putative protease